MVPTRTSIILKTFSLGRRVVVLQTIGPPAMQLEVRYKKKFLI